MSLKHRLYLAPGFFGFANLGELVYFGHVRDFLVAEFARRGVPAEVHAVPSHPTASIRVRARDLQAVIAQTAQGDDGPLHLIGHSTGGLDARLLITPHVQLGEELEIERYAQRVRTLVSVATPHHGTPLASLFGSMLGAKMLGLLSLFTLYSLRYGRLPMSALFRIVGALVRADDRLGWKATLVDQLFAQLLSDFSHERRQALVTFLAQVSNDQSLVTQLALEAMDLFNAGTVDRPGVRYGSVVTRARRPSFKGRLSAGVSPYAQGTYQLYSFLHRKACAFPEVRRPRLSLEQLDRLRDETGALPELRSSDGIVPTWSQPWGEVIASVQADHLDVIGHFDGPTHHPPHVDWLLSNSGFRRTQFEAVWRQVVDFCLRPPLVTERHESL